MALIKCPHCGAENDTRKQRSAGDRVVKCAACDFVIVTPEQVAHIIRDETGEEGARPTPDSDGPRTDISSRVHLPDLPVAPAEPVARTLLLTATAGPDAGKEWRLGKPLAFIGRRNADVILTDTEVSRQHAVIELHGESFVIKDLESTNGTLLDGVKVKEAELHDGSKVRIGDTVLVVGFAPGSAGG